MMAPILAFTDFKRPFRLETDALKEGLGAVLLQELDDNQFHPVAFASRELKGGEPKYPHQNLSSWPLMGLNNLLMYILTTPNLDALGHRWVAALASYNKKLEYLKGSDNKVAPEKLDEETITELLNW